MAFRIPFSAQAIRRFYRPCFFLGAGLLVLGAIGGLAHDVLAERRLPPPDEQHFRKADRALKAGDFDKAALEYRLGIRIRPDLDTGFLGLAEVLAATGSMEQRIENFQALLRVNPRHLGAHAAIADLFDQLNRPERSLPHYVFLAGAEPLDADVSFNLGLGFLKTRRLAEAIRELLRAVELRPGDPRIHNALGVTWIETGDVGPAASAFENASRLDPAQEGYRHNFEKAREALATRTSEGAGSR